MTFFRIHSVDPPPVQTAIRTARRPGTTWSAALLGLTLLITLGLGGCLGGDGDPAAVALSKQAAVLFGPLPSRVPNPDVEATQARIRLGRLLFYEGRLSKNYDISCNSCHRLDWAGVDNQPTSPGHRGRRGDRNSPTVYNAALHVAQFWDGRAPDVEEQAKGPILNPVEMAAPSEAHIVEVLASIPGYVKAFKAAFPEDGDQAVSYDNMALAIGAFERGLMTPGRFDRFMKGDISALNADEQRGLETFIKTGCVSCHAGPAVGGQLYRKLGLIFPYETEDVGREGVTGLASDRHVFKVPSLRNIVDTGPYLHDGSIAKLESVVHIMGYHQIGVKLEPEQIEDIVSFLGSLSGKVDMKYIALPQLPNSGPTTPMADPS